MRYKDAVKRIPIVLAKGIFLYLIIMSNTTAIIGPISQECSNKQLFLFIILIGFLIGLIIEVMKEI